MARITDPSATPATLLEPLADLYGTVPQRRPDGRWRLDDASEATLAMVVPQAGGRERVTEIVTPPIAAEHGRRLADLLDPGRGLGFFVPAEAAVHVHLDAEPFRSGAALARLVRCFVEQREELWYQLGTNRQCRRLGPVDDDLRDLVAEPGFEARPWPEIEDRLRTVPLSRFRDLNLVNLRDRTPGKDTVEIRILPGSCDAGEILDRIHTLGRFLAWPS